mmetsp:Transcript_20685/g.33809  ORF Transcript_20685/g.33809 Transcript_20685/m.33809 type:complete len:89 (-) Transcript_20685:292-558(-)
MLHAIENEDGLSCGLSESPDIELETTIYEAAAVPVINNIINADGNSLKQMQLPKSGVRLRSNSVSISTQIEPFSGKYSRLKIILRPSC